MGRTESEKYEKKLFIYFKQDHIDLSDLSDSLHSRSSDLLYVGSSDLIYVKKIYMIKTANCTVQMVHAS